LWDCDLFDVVLRLPLHYRLFAAAAAAAVAAALLRLLAGQCTQ